MYRTQWDCVWHRGQEQKVDCEPRSSEEFSEAKLQQRRVSNQKSNLAKKPRDHKCRACPDHSLILKKVEEAKTGTVLCFLLGVNEKTLGGERESPWPWGLRAGEGRTALFDRCPWPGMTNTWHGGCLMLSGGGGVFEGFAKQPFPLFPNLWSMNR